MKPRKILRIGRWEVTKNAGGVDRRTLAVVAVAILLLVIVGPLVAAGGVSLDDGLYRVSVSESSPYYEVVESDDTFVIVENATHDDLQDGDVDLFIRGQQVTAAPTQKGEAAYAELRDSVTGYNNRQLALETNQTAAFPVSVILEFRNQPGSVDGTGSQLDGDQGPADGTDGQDGTDGTDGTDGQDGTDGTDGSDGTDGTDGSDSTDGDGTDGTDGQDGTDGDGTDGSDGGDGTGTDGDDDGGTVADSDGGSGGIGGPFANDAITGSPADITPPFPFQSLVLAFLFVIPLNFLIQAYGSTILSERINRRGELLLVSPVSRYDIIAGKTLPYFLGAMAVEALLAVGLIYVTRGAIGGLLSILALMPLVLLFLGATFLGAMFARSFKELTFVTVTITVSLTTYAFVPAIFTDVDQIALISPLTIVVRELQNEAVAAPEAVFSILPPLLVATVLFALGGGLYREEDMFDQRSISGRVLDALVGPITKRWHVGAMTAVLIPFVFVSQLVAIALFFALGGLTFALGGSQVPLSIILMLVVVAFTEEIAKSLHIYAAYEHRRFDSSLRTGLVLGALSGAGFFLGEKIALITQLVGLPELAIGEAGLAGGVPTGPIVLLFLIAPLLLHVVTATMSTLGARRGKQTYMAAVTLAMVVHFVYNLTVVILFVT